MAVTIVIAIKLVGIVLVSALLVLPAATARQLTSRIGRLVALSIGLAVIFTSAGLYLSYQLNLASGASIVLLAGMLFFLSLVVRTLRR
jgi:zinc transport system permease protein